MEIRIKPIVASLAAAGIVAFAVGVAAPSHAGILDVFGHRQPSSDMARKDVVSPATEPAPAPGVAAPNYRYIVKTWGPAVVGVTVEGVRKLGQDGDAPQALNENDPFFQFFRGLPGFQFQAPRNAEQPFKGLGSGFIVTPDGLIMTNAHVVRDARDVTVKLADRREFTAKVLGSDPVTDVAILKIDAHDLPTVRIGDPSALQVGDNVLAIGAPFGFDESATAGIVSAKGRSLPGDSVVPFIQTDAAVNPGNSGGPLFDANGNVVGINAQIYSQTGGYQGLSFAIPIDVALHAKDQIVATGHASHARLGVVVQDLGQSLADSFGLARPDGALISSVEPDSAAAKAGLKPGDVITQVDSDPVTRAGDLSQHIGMGTPGTRIDLTVWRDHASRHVDAILGSSGSEDTGGLQQASAGGATLGLALRPLTSDERGEASVDHGLMVEQAAGAAARAGIQPGDVLVGIDGQPAKTVQQVRDEVKHHGKVVALLIERNGQQIFVPVKLG
ncbi:MAG TPA: Do family serine endopeptidase [Burkholderiaceae bacterium]|nr:Do family serine endopeptidase [Burkholderiaceae bacterium]